jgi:hypothetical protein
MWILLTQNPIPLSAALLIGVLTAWWALRRAPDDPS